jgi:hypothetical protein
MIHNNYFLSIFVCNYYNERMKLTMKKVEKKWFGAILITILAIVVMDILTQNASSPMIHRLFNVITEKNIPSLFSTLQLMLSGSLLYSTYRICTEKKWMTKHVKFWKYLSYIFYFLAFDEWFTVHDIIGDYAAAYMGSLGDLFGWTLLYLIIMVVFFIWAIQFLVQLPKRTSILFIISGGIFILGAIGFELMASQTIRSMIGLQSSPAIVYTIGILEESCEMMGIFLFNWATFIYLISQDKFVSITVSSKMFAISAVIGIIDIILTYYYTFFII